MDVKPGSKRRRPGAVPEGPKLFGSKDQIDQEQPSKKGQSLKNKIRSLRRLLARPELPRNLRIDKKRMLKKLLERHAESQVGKREKKYYEKYKQIKFHEMQKAERKLRKAQKALAELQAANASEPELQAAEVVLEAAKDDIIYIKWFPKHLKYVGLFAKADSKDERLEARKEALRRWARANAAANTFTTSPPAADANVDFDESEDEQMGGSVSSDSDHDDDEGEEEAEEEEGRDKKAKPAVQGKKSEAKKPEKDSKDSSSSGEDGSEAAEEAMNKRKRQRTASVSSRDSRKHEEQKPDKVDKAKKDKPVDTGLAVPSKVKNHAAVILPSRPVARKPPHLRTALGAGALLPGQTAACDVDSAIDPESGAAQVEIAMDPFFAGDDVGGGGGEVAFQEEAWDDSMLPVQGERIGYGEARGGGGYEVRGPRGSAARWEKEHMDTARYKGKEHARGLMTTTNGQPAGAGAGDAPRSGAGKPAADLSHLSGRKLRRAQRAQEYAKKRTDPSSSGIASFLPGAGTYSESFFGTDKDPGARMISSTRVAHANRAAHGQKRPWGDAHARDRDSGSGSGAWGRGANAGSSTPAGYRPHTSQASLNGAHAAATSAPNPAKAGKAHLKFVEA